MRVKLLVGVVVCVASSIIPAAAQQIGAATPEATTLARQSLQAMGGSGVVGDVTLTGSAIRTFANESETGNFTLKGLGSDQSRFDLVLSSGTRTEIFNISTGNAPTGFWSAGDGQFHQMANHNCLVGQVWFFPALAAAPQPSGFGSLLAYVGTEVKNGMTVQHLRYGTLTQGATSSTAAIATLMTADVYLDSVSHLPVSLVFNVHPDNNMLVNIPVEVYFSSYKLINGVQVPFRIQKYFNGALLLDLTVENATVNSGLTTSSFSVN